MVECRAWYGVGVIAQRVDGCGSNRDRTTENAEVGG